MTSMCEMVDQLIQKKQEEKQFQEDQATNARYWKIPAYYDDDDDYNFPITPNEPVDSLNEFIKSSVENLVLNPSKSKGKNGCDMLACFTTFSNILFDAEYEFDSVDDQSLHNEDFLEEIFLNPLFQEEINSMRTGQHHFNVESDLIGSLLNHDSSIIPSSLKIDSLLDEFVGELPLLKSIPPRIDITDYHPENEICFSQRLLYDNLSPRPPEEFNKLMEQISSICEMVDQLIQKKQEEKQIQEDQAVNTRYWKIPAYYDDDDDYNFAITPNETIDSLIMGDEHLDTVPTTESDELIKSCVENLVPNPSESEDENGCDMLACFTTFSNILFDAEYEFDSILLYDNSSPRPPEEFVSENSNADIESFSPSPIMEEIDLTFTPDDPMPPSIEEDDDVSRDTLIREELLDNYSHSLPKNESFHFDIPLSSRPPAKPPDGNTGILNIKMMGDVSDQKVPTPELTITLVSN
nr:hypothetical protein [Tanacetum cinerariifolium]